MNCKHCKEVVRFCNCSQCAAGNKIIILDIVHWCKANNNDVHEPMDALAQMVYDNVSTGKGSPGSANQEP